MIDAIRELERYGDHLDAAIAPVTLDEVRNRSVEASAPVRRRVPSWAVVIAVAAVSLMVIGTASVFLGGSDGSFESQQPAQTSVATVPLLPVEPPTAPSYVWSRVETVGLAGPYLFMDAVVAGGPGLIAVGSPGSDGSEMLWTSSNGFDWTPAQVQGDGHVFDVAVGGPGFVAVGSNVWTSIDGIVWEGVPTNPIRGEAYAVTAGGPGLVAVGSIADGPAEVWTSVDGIVWEAVPHSDEVFGGYAPMTSAQGYLEAEMLDVVAGGPGLIAVGRYGPSAAVWTSTDGLEWSRIPHDPSVFGDDPTLFGDDTVEAEMLSVTSSDLGYVAVSAIGDTGKGVWMSPDGVAWTSVALDPDVFNSDEEMTTVISVPGGVLAAGFEGKEAAVWFSADARDWTRVMGAGLAGEAIEGISDLAIHDNGVVAVGWSWQEDGGEAVVWVGEASP